MIAGLDQAMAALMQQFGGGGQTIPGVMPSAFQTNTAAASVPGWSPASGAGAMGNAPMASAMQSVPGMTAQQSPMMGVLSQPQSYGGGGGGQQGGGIARQAGSMALSAAATAALTPILGPAAPIVGPMVGQTLGGFIPSKGGGGGGAAPPPPPLKQAAPGGHIPDMGMSGGQNDMYAMLLQALQQQGGGGMRM